MQFHPNVLDSRGRKQRRVWEKRGDALKAQAVHVPHVGLWPFSVVNVGSSVQRALQLSRENWEKILSLRPHFRVQRCFCRAIPLPLPSGFHWAPTHKQLMQVQQQRPPSLEQVSIAMRLLDLPHGWFGHVSLLKSGNGEHLHVFFKGSPNLDSVWSEVLHIPTGSSQRSPLVLGFCQGWS